MVNQIFVMSLGSEKAKARGSKLGIEPINVYRLRSIARGQTPRQTSPAVTAGSSPESREVKDMNLKELFSEAERVGGKYQTKKEREAFKAQMDAAQGKTELSGLFSEAERVGKKYQTKKSRK